MISKLNSKKKYKLSSSFPANTISQWFDIYQGFCNTIILYFETKKKPYNWDSFMNLVIEVKLFLKSKGVKFI